MDKTVYSTDCSRKRKVHKKYYVLINQVGGPDGKFWLEVMTYGQRNDRLERHFIEILVIISKGGSSLTLVSWRYSYPPSSVNPKVLVMYSFHVTLSLLFMSRSLNMASTSSSTVHFCILCRTQISNSASSTKPSLLISIRGTSILNEKKIISFGKN